MTEALQTNPVDPEISVVRVDREEKFDPEILRKCFPDWELSEIPHPRYGFSIGWRFAKEGWKMDFSEGNLTTWQVTIERPGMSPVTSSLRVQTVEVEPATGEIRFSGIDSRGTQGKFSVVANDQGGLEVRDSTDPLMNLVNLEPH